MKRWKKLSLLALALIVATQAPSIYRRYRLGVLKANIAALKLERGPLPADDGYVDYRGVLHVHSRLGGHSLGNPDDILTAARENDLRFVLMTEHGPLAPAAAAAALEGEYSGVIYINGSEATVDGDRFLVVPTLGSSLNVVPSLGSSLKKESGTPTTGDGRSAGELALLAYPEDGLPSSTEKFDGIEIYNAATVARNVGKVRMLFDMFWSHSRYKELMGTALYVRPKANIEAWDNLNAGLSAGLNSNGGRRIVAVAGIDAHANIGLVLQTQASQALAGILFDPYSETMRIARNYVILKSGQRLDGSAVVDAIRGGQVYIGFDLFADAGGFRFTAEGKDQKRIMGEEIPLNEGVRLLVAAPQRARVVLFRNGMIEQSREDAEHHEFSVRQPGVYRVEVHLDRLGPPATEHPWIISNPIYVR